MRIPHGHRIAAVSVTAMLIGAALPARADEKQACVAAYERAQQLRMDGKLQAARAELAVCSRAECPALVRPDCVQWMSEVVQAIPSVVVAARDGQGHDIFDVKVIVDGNVVADRLDGRPVTLDPGPHKFRYETSSAPPVEEQVLIRQGERNRPLTVMFKAPVVVLPEKDHGGQENPPPTHRSPPILAYTFIGMGVVALGFALGLDLKATSDAQNLRDTCKPKCTQSDVDAVQTKYYVAGALLGVGILSAGVGTILLLTRPKEKKPAQGAWTFDVTPVRGGTAATLRAEF